MDSKNDVADGSRASGCSSDGPSAFERDTIHRLATEAARYWLLTHYLANHELPPRGVWFAYPGGCPAAIDWGNAPGPDDPETKPMRGKRVRVTFEIENR